ncbi:glycosyltransferase family 28 C-terminal domain-containing protein, putative [Eimeria necatrix]|uniref:UDP-N-acetylglucosamine transferase subunit ALG13 n=1 Tax=Eimeria necatrix TaxID=51315 RepID=U6MQZ7_9EIME|nr:glycosyltransferase family 28 C-terminal domain-containing protein, putative [Eimeria necatrix]CDJ64050.1 glycosyltransferase family 28 C-terminal domain-containing protein, putative [Eimeria necatrix]
MLGPSAGSPAGETKNGSSGASTTATAAAVCGEASKASENLRVEGSLHVLVTVGTTSFDDLVKAVDSVAFLGVLRSLGKVRLTVQLGRGQYIPFGISAEDPDLTGVGVWVHRQGLQCVRVVRYIHCLSLILPSFDLIVSHCGAGTLLGALRASRRVVACVNQNLQQNHQQELASVLATANHCVAVFDLKVLPQKTLEAWRRPLYTEAGEVIASVGEEGERASEEREQHERPLLPLPSPNVHRFVEIMNEEIEEGMETEETVEVPDKTYMEATHANRDNYR